MEEDYFGFNAKREIEARITHRDLKGLVEFLRHHDPAIRRLALEGMFKVDKEKTHEYAEELKNNNDPQIRILARQILEKNTTDYEEKTGMIVINPDIATFEQEKQKKSSEEDNSAAFSAEIKRRRDGELFAEEPIHEKEDIDALIDAHLEEQKRSRISRGIMFPSEESEARPGGKAVEKSAGLLALAKKISESAEIPEIQTAQSFIENVKSPGLELSCVELDSNKCTLIENALNKIIRSLNFQNNGDNGIILHDAIDGLMKIKEIKLRISRFPDDKKQFNTRKPAGTHMKDAVKIRVKEPK